MSRDAIALFAFTAIMAVSLALQGSYYLPQLRIVTGLAAGVCLLVRPRLPRRALIAFGLLALGLAISWSFTGFAHQAEKPALTLVFCTTMSALAASVTSATSAASVASERGKESVLDAIVLVTSLVAAAGILGVAFHWTRFAFLAQSWRSNVLSYQNADAAVCAIGLLAALVRGGRRTGPRVAAVVIATGLAATQSRGGAIAAAAGILVLLLREHPAALPRLAACSALAFAGLLPALSGAGWGWTTAIPALGVAMLIAGQARRLTPRTTFQVRLALALGAVAAVTVITIVGTPATHRFVTTSNGRTAVWRETLSAIAKHPIVGTGPGTYVPSERQGASLLSAKHAYNEYLETAAETGLIGLAFALSAIGVLGLGVVRRRDPASDAALAAGVVFLVHSSFDFLWRIPALPAIVIVLAVSASPVALRREGRPTART